MSNHFEVPFGLKVLPDRAGLLSSSFVLFVWLYGHIVVFIPILLPHYKDGNVSSLVVYGYILLSLCTIICFFRAMFSNPGVVPRVATENVDWRTWEKCKKCRLARPARSHHCSKCGYCVLEMDHHCQWINNCVGKGNFRIFSLLLVYASTFVNLNIVIYHLHKWSWLGACPACAELWWIDPLQNPVKSLSYLIAAIAFVGITLLLCLTGLHISMGMTTIEAMEDPRTAMKKSMETKRKCIPSFTQLSVLCGGRSFLLWPLPCLTITDNASRRTHIV